MMEKEDLLLLQYNLQFFADSGSGEKTEKATPKKKKKARDEGQVAKSNEITTAFLFIGMFSALKIFGPKMMENILLLIKEMFALFVVKEITITYSISLMKHTMQVLVGLITPLLAVSFFIGLISNFLQVGWNPTAKPLQMKLDKLSPIQGFKRLFSMKALVELLKAILKIAAILILVYITLKDYEKVIITIYDMPIYKAYGMIATICFDLGIKVGILFIIIAAIDFIYQKYDLSKKLKMTKQEVKDEYKQSEGNPEIKSKIRQKMREASMRRMMQELPKADVIITNPTHFAVAIKYDSDNSAAPTVIAKGADLVAAKIREKAKEYYIEIVENKELARTLFYTVEIGEEIPPQLYQTVAEILAFVYNLNKKKNS